MSEEPPTKHGMYDHRVYTQSAASHRGEFSNNNTKMQRTLFAHILDEELLLPSWLNHHRKLFTHGVIVDVGSSDRSVSLIQQFCPTWEIIQLQPEQRATLATTMMEELEAKYDGWKCVLNCSEYLVVGNLETYLLKWEERNPGGIGVRATGIIIVDRPGQTGLDNFRHLDMLTEKDFGYLERGKAWDGSERGGRFGVSPCSCYRNRVLHRSRTGLYRPGRHTSDLCTSIDPKLFIAWIGRGSPELYRSRCKTWGGNNQSFSPQHFQAMSDESKMNNFWKQELEKASSLFEILPEYHQAILQLYPSLS